MRVIIIGAGIGGLTAAVALQRVGLDAHIYERAPEPREVGAGISLWTNAIRCLEYLGLGEAIRVRTFSNLRGDLRTSRGAVLSAIASEELARDYGVTAALLHRADLLSILLNEVPGGRIHFDHACVGFTQAPKTVEVRFANNDLVTGDVLVGADGLHSVVRDSLFGAGPPLYAGYSAWRAIVNFESANLRSSESWGPGRRFGLIPMSDGRVYWFATNNAPEGQQDPPGQAKASLQQLFRDWHDPIPSLLEATEESSILHNDIYDREPLPRWSVQRVTLLGDAAHPMTPNLGQGGCQAIEDALVLAVSLAGEADVAAALRFYETRRIPRTSKVVRSSRRLGQLAQLQSPFLCSLRNAAIRATPKSVSARQLNSVAAYEPLTKEEIAFLHRRSSFGTSSAPA